MDTCFQCRLIKITKMKFMGISVADLIMCHQPGFAYI